MKSPIYLLLIAISSAALWSCGSGRQEQQSGERAASTATATAQIGPASGSRVEGTATFTQTENGVRMTLDLRNVAPGLHALHLHEKGDCSAPDATSAGDHWNPTSEAHGHRGHSDEFHAGDIDNIEAASDSTVQFEATVEGWSIGGDPNTDIIGKAVIIHANPDDFTSQPSGNAGARIACGVISLD